jgi:hypothetical protein
VSTAVFLASGWIHGGTTHAPSVRYRRGYVRVCTVCSITIGLLTSLFDSHCGGSIPQANTSCLSVGVATFFCGRIRYPGLGFT